ncbi:Phenylalanine--tRNA ligase beta subunit [Labeo rohita]|uniref:Phenylalanine--tRNA ligase beta subunit n=1 Tax=Labeo rohita TaxID=84645 RepID=A0ABQ8LXP8_LABRO|nr:Phenylalanine--tRNA ligase beta subunit [Labeo rohita]
MSLSVVAMLLCIVLSSEASDVLQCKGEKLSEGQFFFNMSYDVKENIQDCETQWLADGKVAGIYDVEGKVEFILPIVKMTEKTAILETCPERLEFLLMCPTTNVSIILSMKSTSALVSDASPPITLPKVGFPNWSVYIWIGGSVFVVSMIVTGIIVVYQKRQRCGYAPGPANEIV